MKRINSAARMTVAFFLILAFGATHSFADIIDDTYGIGAGSFELGSFVNGGGPAPASQGHMGLLPGDNTTIVGWTVGGPGDGVDWLISPTYAADSGVHSIDLQHLTNSSVFTTIPTLTGSTYRLTFGAAALEGRMARTGVVSAGSLVNQPFSAEISPTTSGQTYTGFDFIFLATGPTTTITFTATDINILSYGPVIDSVSVVQVPEPIRGDVNLDGVVDFLDISPFIAVLSGGGFQAEADCDENGTVDFLDISPFIAILSGS